MRATQSRQSAVKSKSQLTTAGADRWDLRLYVANSLPSSARACANLRSFCEHYLAGRYRIKVIDLCKYPGLAKRDGIVVIPTLVRRRPLPLRTLVGDLSSTQRTLVGLDLLPRFEHGAHDKQGLK